MIRKTPERTSSTCFVAWTSFCRGGTNRDFSTLQARFKSLLGEHSQRVGASGHVNDPWIKLKLNEYEKKVQMLGSGVPQDVKQVDLLSDVATAFKAATVTNGLSDLGVVDTTNQALGAKAQIDKAVRDIGRIFGGLVLRQTETINLFEKIMAARDGGVADIQIARKLGINGWNNIAAATGLVDNLALSTYNTTMKWLKQNASSLDVISQSIMTKFRQERYQADTEDLQRVFDAVMMAGTAAAFVGSLGSFGASVRQLNVRRETAAERLVSRQEVETEFIDASNAKGIREDMEGWKRAKQGGDQSRLQLYRSAYPGVDENNLDTALAQARKVIVAETNYQTSHRLHEIGKQQMVAWTFTLLGAAGVVSGRSGSMANNGQFKAGDREGGIPDEWQPNDQQKQLLSESKLGESVRAMTGAAYPQFGDALGRFLSVCWHTNPAGKGTRTGRTVDTGEININGLMVPSIYNLAREAWDKGYWASLVLGPAKERIKHGLLTRYIGIVNAAPPRAFDYIRDTSYEEVFADAADIDGVLGPALKSFVP